MTHPHHILVTGATGLLGQDLVAELLKQGFITHILLRPTAFCPFPPHSRLIIHRGDMTDIHSLIRSLKGIDAVVHLAANKYHPSLSYQVNVQGARNLKQAMLKTKVRRLINLTSQSTKISRRGVYGTTKKLSDEILHNPSIFQVTTLAPSLVYGDDPTSLFHTVARYVKSLPLVPVFGNGHWRLFPIRVSDVSAAIIACLTNPQTIDQFYDLGCARSLTMNQLVAKIAHLYHRPTRILHLPVWLGLLGAKLLRLVTPNPSVTADNILGSTQDTHCHPSRAIKQLKLKPLPVAVGLRQTLLPSADQIKVMIIGAGKMGLLHAAILTVLPHARVVAIVDTNPSLLKTALSWGPPLQVFSSLSAAIATTRPDLAFICTPTYTHFSLAKDCLRHGLHVFIEKPTTLNFATTQKLLDVSRHYPKLQISTGYYYLYRPLYRLASQLLKSGKIGQPLSFTATIAHSEVFGLKQGWLFDPAKSGGGVLINPSPHLLSLLTYFFGLPSQVSCTTRSIYSSYVEDKAKVKLVYKSGLTGKLTASWSQPRVPILRNHLTIQGSKGKLKLTNNQLFVNSRQVKLPDLDILNLNPAQGAEGYYLQDQAVVNALSRKHLVPTDLRFAAQVEYIISRCYQSATLSQPVNL